ncbi:hypothetical protein [Umezawaea sp. NPDC059074]|uniref:hypothetical protein n=1 Tax=Umezawaea sp. NPDC059074 TaxID=3346716 RepID=UPI003686F9B6
MAKSAGQKRRRKEQRRERVREVRAAERARRPSRPAVKEVSARKVTIWTIVGIAAFIGLLPAFWNWIAPAISDLVAPVPPLAVLAGWLPVGGLVTATGFFLVNYDDLLARTRVRLAWVLGVWGVPALATMPVVRSPPLVYDYLAGLEVGFFGTLLGGVVVPLAVALLWKPFHRGKEPSAAVWGYALTILGGVLLLLAVTVAWLV